MWKTLSLVVILLSACGAEPGSPAPDAGPDAEDATSIPADAAPGADLTEAPDVLPAVDAGEADLGPSCDDPRATPDLPCGQLSWAMSQSRSRPRNHHVSAIVHTSGGPFLVAVGGVNGHRPIDYVDVAAVQSDGSLGPWVGTQSLPSATGGGTIGVVSRVIVVAGGMTARGVTDLSYSTVVDQDGTIAPWSPAGSTGHPRMHPGGFTLGDRVYVLGGFEDMEVWDDAVSVQVGAEGLQGEWSPAGSLPGPRSHFSVSVVDRYVYLAGGLEESAYVNPPLLAEVQRGEIGEDGVLGNWVAMPALPVGLATHASFVYGGHLYVGGGITEAGQEQRMWRAPLLEDSSLGAWEEAAPMLVARGHVHQLPMFRNHVYAIAGAMDYDLNSTDQIDIGTFD